MLSKAASSAVQQYLDKPSTLIDLFQSTTVVSRSTIFVLYLHCLSKHASEQYELMCLKSVNTENQEDYLDMQSWLIAECTTNCHPGKIITSTLMHM